MCVCRKQQATGVAFDDADEDWSSSLYSKSCCAARDEWSFNPLTEHENLSAYLWDQSLNFNCFLLNNDF